MRQALCIFFTILGARMEESLLVTQDGSCPPRAGQRYLTEEWTMDISTWVRVSHVAECAALATEGSHEEARQVGQASDKPSLWRVVSVKDTVVDDVILKPISLIDVLLIDKENQDLFH